jgi:hypothetical protein
MSAKFNVFSQTKEKKNKKTKKQKQKQKSKQTKKCKGHGGVSAGCGLSITDWGRCVRA